MKAAGLDTPVLDARLIVQHALAIGWETLFLREDQPLAEPERVRLEEYLGRRAAREPVSRIVGRRHFWTLDLAVSPDTLDPRADTESVVESVVALFPDRAGNRRILDLGTGTGALLLALLAEYPDATGLGVDRSPGALAMARLNAASFRMGDRALFVEGNWCSDIVGRFDVIVSNPPYIKRPDLKALPPEVLSYDPLMALDGGDDGLEAYRSIMPHLPRLLAAGGVAVFEIGIGQGQSVTALAASQGLQCVSSRNDLSGIERALAFARRQT